jgi:ribosomal protein L7/L12
MPSDATSDPPDPPDSEEVETTFRRLRRDGHTRLEALRMILGVLDVSLAEAKRLLTQADTWAEVRSEMEQETASGGDVDAGEDPVPPAPA